MDPPAAPSRCPGCAAGLLRITRFKARPESGRARLPQLGHYETGGIRPTVVAECTAGCGFVAEGPGTRLMLGTILGGEARPPAACA